MIKTRIGPSFTRAWCVTRPGGRAVVGVPVHRSERVIFNGCRLYGRTTLPHLFANWRQLSTDMDPAVVEARGEECPWCYQPIFVVEKGSSGDNYCDFN